MCSLSGPCGRLVRRPIVDGLQSYTFVQMKSQTTVEDTNSLDIGKRTGHLLSLMNDIVLLIICGVIGMVLVVLGILVIL